MRLRNRTGAYCLAVLALGAVYAATGMLGLLVALLAVMTGRTAVVQRQVDQRTSELHEANEKLNEVLSKSTASVATMRDLAMRDQLTGLLNRRSLLETLSQSIQRTRRVNDYAFAVLLLDFDHFKLVNDTFGHEAGDRLLCNIGKRLRGELRGNDSAARLGGDEFVVILDAVDDANAMRKGQRLLESLSRPHEIAGQKVVSTPSIGLVVSSSEYTDAGNMLRDADVAMYRAKAAGRARLVAYDDRMRRQQVERSELERQLRCAIERGRVSLAYQPVVDLIEGGVVSQEALLRFQRDDGKVLNAREFLSNAEDIGIGDTFSRWALKRACAEWLQWHGKRSDVGQLRVNIQRQHLMRTDFMDDLDAILVEGGFPAEALILEVSETDLLRYRDQILPVLSEIGSRNVQISIDDFGAGQIALDALHAAPLSEIKLDGRFVAHLEANLNYTAMLHGIIKLAHAMGIRVVAEGIETAEQLAQLQATDCDLGQGIALHRPVAIGQGHPDPSEETDEYRAKSA